MFVNKKRKRLENRVEWACLAVFHNPAQGCAKLGYFAGGFGNFGGCGLGWFLFGAIHHLFH